MSSTCRGKSRLVHEFAERARAVGARVVVAHCASHGKNVPLLGYLDMLRDDFQITDRDDATASACREIQWRDRPRLSVRGQMERQLMNCLACNHSDPERAKFCLVIPYLRFGSTPQSETREAPTRKHLADKIV